MDNLLEAQTRILHDTLTRLLRSSQICDRNGCASYGLSVSQFQALESIATTKNITMTALAKRMWLTASTMTRIVSQLVQKKLVKRCYRPGDRRVCCVVVTSAGLNLYRRMRSDLTLQEKTILMAMPPGERQQILDTLQRFLGFAESAVEACCDPRRKPEGASDDTLVQLSRDVRNH